jgi:aspartate/methionine/tyrosine aminotransferase
MKIETFKMERMQSTYENLVEYNLSESGVHPISLREILDGNSELIERLLSTELGYVQSNGTPELRQRIAGLYPGATTEHVIVTNGTAEANLLNAMTLVDEGDEVLMMLPNYMQLPGICRALGGKVKPFHLREQNGRWAVDIDQFKQAVTSKTKLIAVCNPNNPTGAVMTKEEMDTIIKVASSCGAWLLSDEVYRGAELELPLTPSFWGTYERVIITSGLSKAYGIPGLRIGWAVAQPDLIARLWASRDYTTIGCGMLSDFISREALKPAKREAILNRTRGILRKNFPVLKEWVTSHGEMFSMIDPQAGAIALIRYKLKVGSLELIEKLRVEKSVLIVPGDHFGLEHYVRIGYGSPPDYIRAGLDRVHATLMEYV